MSLSSFPGHPTLIYYLLFINFNFLYSNLVIIFNILVFSYFSQQYLAIIRIMIFTLMILLNNEPHSKYIDDIS
jgi:hypothetical protein